MLNAALQGATVADLRTAFLEDQVADVAGNAAGMHGSLGDARSAVAARADCRAAFASAIAGRR